MGENRSWLALIVIFSICLLTRAYGEAGFLQISPTNQTIVKGTTAQFTATVSGDASGPYTITWSNPYGGIYGMGESIVVSNAGKYTVTGTDANGQVLAAACATLNVKIPPSVAATNRDPLTCSLTQVAVYAATSAKGPQYSWTGPGIVSGADSSMAMVNLPGTYTVTVTASNGCTASASCTVTQDVTPPPLAIDQPEVLSCLRTAIVLHAHSSSNTVFQWSGPGIVSGASSSNCIVSVPGTYTATVRSLSVGLISSGTISNSGTNIIIDQWGGTNDYGISTNYPYVAPDYNGLTNLPVISTDLCPDVPYGAEIDPNGITNYISPLNFGGASISNDGHVGFHYDMSLSSYGNGCANTTSVTVEFSSDPCLTIVTNGNAVTVTWPSTTTNYTLEESSDLITWTPVTHTSNETNNVHEASVTAVQKFLRLRKE